MKTKSHAPAPHVLRGTLTLLGTFAAFLIGLIFMPDSAQMQSFISKTDSQTLAPQTANRPDILWMRGGHTSLTNQTFYAPDGEKVVVGTNGQVKVFRPSDGTLLLTVNSVATGGDCTNPMMTSPFAISPDSRKLAVMVDAPQPVGKAIQFWDIASGALDSSIAATFNSGVAFSPDGTRLIAGRTIYSTANNSLAYTFPAGKFPAFFSQNQQFIYGSIDNNSNCDGNRSIVEFNGSNYSQIRTIGVGIPQAISPNGALIINSYPGDVIRVSDGVVVHSLGQSGPNPYHNYKFSPNGQYVAVGRSYARSINNGQPTIVIKRTSDWSQVRSFVADDINVNSDSGNVSISFSPDSQTLAASNWTTRLWSVADGSLIRELNQTFAGGVSSLAFSSDGQTLVTTNSSSAGYPPNQYLNLWNVADGTRRNINFPDSSGSSFRKVSFADNNQKLVTWQSYFYTSNTTIKVWDAANGTVLRSADSFNYAGFTVAPNGQEMAVSTGQIRIENIATGTEIRTFGGGHQRGDYPLAYSPDGQFIVASTTSYGSYAGIKLWRVSDGTELLTFANTSGYLSRINGGVAFSPDGATIAVAYEDTYNSPLTGTIRVFRVSDGALLQTMTGFQHWAGSLTFSANGQYIIATGWDSTIRIFRVSDGVQVNLYTNETGFQPGSNYTLGQIALSPDGSRFAYARADATVVMARNPYATTPPTTFTISGNITRGGSPLGGVAVNLSGNSSASATTDAGGNYSFTVNEGGSYTVTPALVNHTFTPPSQTFNFVAGNQTANFTAQLITYTISGNVRADGANLAGATVSLSGGQTASVQTDANGNYSFTVAAGASYAVSVYKSGFNFDPASRTFMSLQANQTANFQNGAALCTPPPFGLQHFYKGENSTSDVWSGNTGSSSGSYGYSSGFIGNSFSFSGNGNVQANVPNYSQISIAAWVYVTGGQGTNRDIVGKDGEGFDRQFWLSAATTNRFRAHLGSTNGQLYNFDSNTVIQENTWYFVVMTYNGLDFNLFVNGQYDSGRTAFGSIINTSQAFRIGGGAPSGQPQLYFYGLIDETQVYNRALSTSEIQTLYNTRGRGNCGSSNTVQTPTGNNVSINPVANLSVNYGTVGTAGTTTATLINPASAGALPSGYQLTAQSVAYDIRTSAQFSGNITTIFNVTGVPNAAACADLRVLHYETSANALQDVTVGTNGYNSGTQVCTVTARTTSLSPFVVARQLAPLAANVSVSGRISAANGNGIRNVVVTLTDANGNTRRTKSSSFGYYSFNELEAGETYTISVQSKRYTFNQPTQILTVQEDLSDVDFTANE